MITEFLSAYSHFCSKILRIWQKIAIEYRSYKGLTRSNTLFSVSVDSIEYRSYKVLTLVMRDI